MTTELIAIFGMAVTILISMGVMFRSFRGEMHAFRNELKTDIANVKIDLKSDIASVKTELGTNIGSVKTELGLDIASLHDGQNTINNRLNALSERMAHLEGLLEGLREAITGRSAA